MADECRAFISDPFVFPRQPDNRPALPAIDYRIGDYASFRERLLRDIDAAVELAAWTHRDADDPGIALLEGAALLGDVLSFYQQRYANECFLRTARWRESVAALVRLLGYRLAPGIAGRATFALEVRRRLSVPAGFALKAELDALADPAEFQTAVELLAEPQLSRFHLYRARHYATALAGGVARCELAAVDGASDAASLDAALKPGDRIVLIPPEPAWTLSAVALGPQSAPQLLKVKAVRRVLERRIVEFDNPPPADWPLPVLAYRLGRSFRHFGHAAPPTRSVSRKDAAGVITGAYEYATDYERHLKPNHACGLTDCSITLPATLLPLDGEVPELVAGSRVLVETLVREDADSDVHYPLAAVRRISAARFGTLGFGTLNGSATLLTLTQPLLRHDGFPDLRADVRDFRIQDISGPALQLRPCAEFDDGAFASAEAALYFFGSAAEAAPLAARALLLLHADGRQATLACTNVPADFPAGADEAPRLWPLSFASPPPFPREDFDETQPHVEVLGNLVEATQGRAEAEVALGNGDGRARFQTFRVPKTPLTYLLAAGATPPQRPQLEVRVDGRLWTQVESLFGRGPLEEVYLVREDSDGNSWVQFGDGETGARLPSGVGNVRARYRSGNGAHGVLKTGTTPSAGQRLDGLDKVLLPGVVGGGAEPEAAERARSNAPGRVQGLGRLVSLADYETELRSLPGVTAARASWGLADGVPALTLQVLLAAGREAEFAQVRTSIAQYQHCRGPDRYPTLVQQARLRYVQLDLRWAGDARLDAADIEARIRSALGLAGDEASAYSGLFGLYRRRLGEGEYASRIEGCVQQVAGVLWCRVLALGLLAAGIDAPAAVPLPASPRPLAERLSCADTELLALHPAQLVLLQAPAPNLEVCA